MVRLRLTKTKIEIEISSVIVARLSESEVFSRHLSRSLEGFFINCAIAYLLQICMICTIPVDRELIRLLNG